jgi:hypothetical protein
MKNTLVEYEIIREPQGETYSELLSYARKYCDSMSVVLRLDLGLTSTGHEFLLNTKEHVRKICIGSSWPGTELINQVAVIIYFYFNDFVLNKILKYSTKLYQWIQPCLPEDLCLYRGDAPWLISVAHEKLSWLKVSPNELNEMFAIVSGMKDIVHLPKI